MAKKKLRRVVISISANLIDEVMADMEYRVGSVGGGTVEYEAETFLFDEVLIRAIAQKLLRKLKSYKNRHLNYN